MSLARVFLKVSFALIVTFLALSGAVRLWELNSNMYRHDIVPFCDPKLPLGWGYRCDDERLREYSSMISIEDVKVNSSMNESNVVIS